MNFKLTTNKIFIKSIVNALIIKLMLIYRFNFHGLSDKTSKNVGYPEIQIIV